MADEMVATAGAPLPAPASGLNLANMSNVVHDMPMSRKIGLAAIAALLVGAVLVVFLWSSRPQDQVLYSGLNQQDAAQVVSRLKDLKIPYSLEFDGSVVKVPAQYVHETRLSLASEGIPKGHGVGFEVFNKVEMGTTEFVQKINYQRALQGELARTISGLSEVQDAKVHIVMPRDSLFVEEEKKPTAGVVLSLAAGRSLSPNQISGIVHLVASSVPDLTAEGVTIVDSKGNLLFRKDVDSPDYAAGLSGTQLDYQRNFERNLKNKVETMLEQVLGPGRAVVRVAADIDFTRSTTTQDLFDPDQVALRSESRTTENTRNMGLGPQGSPDQRFTLAQRNANPNIEQSGSESNRENEMNNFEVSRTQRHSTLALGGLQRLTVAVVIDGPYREELNEEGRMVRNFIPRSEDEMSQLSNIVRRAVGFNEGRGDEVTMANVPFAMTMEATVAQPKQWQDYIFDYSTPLISLIVAVLALFFVVRPLLKFLMAKGDPGLTSPVTMTPRGVGPADALPGADELDSIGDMGAGLGGARRKLSTRDHALTLALQNPESATAVIRTWVRESMEKKDNG